MNLSIRLQLIYNISKFSLDTRIGKMLTGVTATGNYPGERLSKKYGYSPEIIDFKPYQQGDALKNIDWKIFARTEQVLVKLRQGYARTDFCIVIDSSESMFTFYSESECSKIVAGLTLAYIAARVALKAKDRVFIILNNKKIKIDSEQELIDILSDIEFYKKETDDFWNTDFNFRSDYFIISDFFVEKEKYELFLKKVLSVSKMLFLFIVKDKVESDFNFEGKYHFLDTESKDAVLAVSSELKNKYLSMYKEHFMSISKYARLYGIKSREYINTEDPLSFFIKAVL